MRLLLRVHSSPWSQTIFLSSISAMKTNKSLALIGVYYVPLFQFMGWNCNVTSVAGTMRLPQNYCFEIFSIIFPNKNLIFPNKNFDLDVTDVHSAGFNWQAKIRSVAKLAFHDSLILVKGIPSHGKAVFIMKSWSSTIKIYTIKINAMIRMPLFWSSYWKQIIGISQTDFLTNDWSLFTAYSNYWWCRWAR